MVVDKNQKFLKQNDTIPLDDDHNIVQLPYGHLEFKTNGTQLHVTYHYEDEGQHKKLEHECDLNAGTLTIGKGDKYDMQFPDPASLSLEAQEKMKRNSNFQAAVALDVDDMPDYLHMGSNKIANPYYQKPQRKEMVEKVEPEEGNGGGFTHENANHNPRTSNEDRAIATRGLPLRDKGAAAYLETAINYNIIPKTVDHPGGSTLSTAMRTKDGNFACSYIGDSPIFVVAQHKQTGHIELLQMGIPHNVLGDKLKQALANSMDYDPPNTQNLKTLQEYARFIDDQYTKDEKDPKLESVHSYITRKIGRMGEPSVRAHTHIPETIIIDPKKECPEDYNFKGIMVCSDGIDAGVGAHKVQDGLTQLYKKNANPTPQEIATVATMAAKNYTTDNVTAMLLPAKGKAGDIIAVADGNTGTAEVADITLQGLREHCQNKFVPLVVKKGNEYRVSLQGNLVSTEQAKPWLQGLADSLRQYEPDRSYQLGTNVVRQTLTVKNPGPRVKQYFENQIRSQEAMQDRGRL